MSSKELKNRLPSPFVSSEIRYNVIIDFCNISVSLGKNFEDLTISCILQESINLDCELEIN